MKFILASGSPRRQELIQLFGMPWEVRVATVDESSVSDPDPAVDVIRTAELKAEAVAAEVSEDAIIVAADTTVVLDGMVFNKPADGDEARLMLKKLRGKTHQVHTGIVVVDKISGRMVTDVATVDVSMRNFNDADIESYIATSDPLDKAGAYAIQHPGFRPVKELTGCYSSVIGLPLCHLARTLRQLDVKIETDIATACQTHHNYICPIYNDILGGEKSSFLAK